MDSLHFISSIKSQREVSPDYFLLSIEIPSYVRMPKPGEFFMIKVGRDNELLLRRPFSLHRLILGDTILILYRRKGKGTQILSERVLGEKLDIIGPLGKGFEISSKINEAIIVAGGIGIAPLLPLAEELKKAGKSIRLFIGGRSKKDILCEDEFRSLNVEIFISTEDGSYGKGGLVTELLEDYLRVQSSEFRVKSSELKTPNSRLKTQMYACGPKAMLKKVSEIAKVYSLPCYVSLEERMACGVGACLGCAVKVRVKSLEIRGKGKNSKLQTPNPKLYKMVCKDGPVFNSEEIDWDG